MTIDYNTVSDLSKIYIFPSDRKFYPGELSRLTSKIEHFTENDLQNEVAWQLKYDRFLLFFVSDKTPLDFDGNELLIRFIQELEKTYSVSLIDKVKVFYKQGEYVQQKEVKAFKKMIKNHSVSKNTIVFNNFINTKSEYECCWEVPASDSWISHFFKK